MAQRVEAKTGHKRGASRSTRAEQHRSEKKRKISTTNASTPLSSSAVQSPTESSPAPEKRPNKLPTRLYEHKPLPTLPEPQPAPLSNDEYQSIAASGVLQASLDRSRLKWVHDGILERYWVKPESGKNARPPPPNNPELKWQKHKGPCRIRIEPHIFEAEVYVEEKAKPAPPPAPPKQYVPPQAYQQSAYGQPYRQGQHPSPYGQQHQQQQPYYQNRALPPMQQQPAHGHPPPAQQHAMGNMPAQAPPPAQAAPARAQQHSPSPAAQDKKASPDPVISMLASRASSDPELKALMKEVATGSASQEQLKVFQNHIDELTKLINDKKKKEEEDAAVAEAAKTGSGQQAGDMIQYDGANDPNLHQPSYQQQQQRLYQPPYQSHPHPHPQPYQHQPAPQQWQPPPPPPLQPPAPPPAPVSHPVTLAFTTPGATEDRFLFPRSCILESLSPQHLLASFIVTRKASKAVDAKALPPDTLHTNPERPSSADKDKDVEEKPETGAETEKKEDVVEDIEFWQPITLMVEVAYNREHIIECVRRWVKPASEVVAEMEAIMKRCVRAEERSLAFRLPVKGSAMAEVEDPAAAAIEAAAIAAAAGEGKGVRGPSKKKKEKKEGEKDKEKGKVEVKEEGAGGAEKAVEKATDATATAVPPPPPAATEIPTETNGVEAVKETGEASADATATAAEDTATETGRPRRAVRKSVRISEG